jgi:hypothetical protein
VRRVYGRNRDYYTVAAVCKGVVFVNTSALVSIIIISISVVPMVILAVFLFHGKGAFLIAGYNTMSSAERETYNERALCRFVGWLLIGVSFSMLTFPVGIYLEMAWLTYLGAAVMIVGVLGGVIYMNTGNRFRIKAGTQGAVAADGEHIKPHTAKRAVVITAVFAIITLAGTGVLLYQGGKDPVVNVSDSGIEIKAMYGTVVDFVDIIDISLIEKSMNDIGAGERVNGYGGIGNALKGHFVSDDLGDILLFTQLKSSPTILIERRGKENIYISFSDTELTKQAYIEMAASVR